MAKKYFGDNSLKTLMELVKSALSLKVNVTDFDKFKDEFEQSVTEEKGEANGLATLDGDGKVPSTQLPIDTAGGVVGLDENKKVDPTLLPTNVANGVAGLDENGKVSVNNLPVNENNGIAGLDENGLVPSSLLPSYVDDVVEGYYDSEADKFYEDETKETEITGEKGKIYVDVATNLSYRWSGTVYVMITSSDMVEITAADVTTMWTEIMDNTDPEEVPVE